MLRIPSLQQISEGAEAEAVLIPLESAPASCRDERKTSVSRRLLLPLKDRIQAPMDSMAMAMVEAVTAAEEVVAVAVVVEAVGEDEALSKLADKFIRL